MEWQERRLDGSDINDDLCRALRLGVQTALWDRAERSFVMLADLQHVDSRRVLVGDVVGERIDIPKLVDEFAP